jgi:hypothetical protein
LRKSPKHFGITNARWSHVAALDGLFWDNPRTLRFGATENLYGYDAIAGFLSHHPAIDLTRHLRNTVIVSYGRDFATANTEFQRVGSEVAARQSQVWSRTDAGWRIAAAHVDLLTPTAARGHLSNAGAAEQAQECAMRASHWPGRH